MKSLTAFGVAFLLMGLPSVMSAQRAAVPGVIAGPPALTLPPYVPEETPEPALAARPAIAEVQGPQNPRSSAEHDKHIKILWTASIVAMLAGTSLDAASSWHKMEGNTLLASSNGLFGARGVGIKAGIAAGVLLPQIVLRKHKDLRIAFAIGNLAEAGMFTGAAIHNFRMSATQY
jgi:hypothetical protein